MVRQFRDAVVPGSHLAISHLTNETRPEAAQRLFQMTQDMHWSTPLICRPRAQIERFFEGFTLVEPGLVFPAQWHPELHNPLLGEDGEPVGKPTRPKHQPSDMHLCGIGVKDQPRRRRSWPRPRRWSRRGSSGAAASRSRCAGRWRT